MEAKASRFKSRILREMHNSENPFNSPPSSTGSHGTVTLTSEVSYIPEGESIQLPGMRPHSRHASNGQTPFKINTSAIGRNFPEWKSWNENTREQTEDIYNTTSDHINQAKENIHPRSSSTANSPTEHKSQDQRQFKVGGGSLRTLSQMQAHVDEDSVNSPALNKTGSHSKPRGGNVTSLIQTLKAAQATKESTPRKSSPKPVDTRHSRLSNVTASPATPNQTARSFFVPNLAHINDFISGALKLSTTKNGIPVFVKHGKVHDRESSSSPSQHADIDAIEIPENEQKIFVSLDKIREELLALQSHDDQVSKQAEQLQEEVYQLQIQLSKLKSRKDSAMGSDSESSMLEHISHQKSQLEEQVTFLQSRLDKANRKISINEIHTESFVTERDEALKSATVRLEEINRLQSDLDAARAELRAAKNDGAHDDTEYRSLREENALLRQEYKSLLDENQSLRSHNSVVQQHNTELQQEIKRLQRALDALQGDNDLMQKEYEIITEQKRTIQQDNLSLERHNDKFYNENKSLQQKNSLLERRSNDLQDDNNRLHELLDVANAETGTVTFDMKDIRNRLEKRNRELSDENVQLQQQVIELQSEYASKRTTFEQEKRRLTTSNDRLNDQIDQISKQFEQIVRDSKEEAAKYEEKQSSLTQQLQDLKTAGVKSKPAKVTRIVEPLTAKGKAPMTEISARSTISQTDMQMQDDYTRQIDLTQDSDFTANILPEAEINQLRETLQKARAKTQQRDEAEEYAEDEAAMTEEMSQSLPLSFMPQAQRNESISIKSKSAKSKGQAESSKSQPLGILKNAQPPRQNPEPDLTGRFSVKSGMSGMSMPSQATRSDLFQGRRHSDSVRFDINVEETSALFMDDITLESRKRAAEKEKAISSSSKATKQKQKAIPTLSKDAKRILDSLCHDHDCRNCIVCTRINSHQHEDERTKEVGKKTTVRVEKPVPVTDRVANPASTALYEDQPTLRPSRDPGIALATVLKNVEDEMAHIKAALAKKNAAYFAIDSSFGKRAQRQLSSEINRIMRALEAKRLVHYLLHDVLEGQKASGQLMNEDEVDVTINSIMSKDVTWDGIVD